MIRNPRGSSISPLSVWGGKTLILIETTARVKHCVLGNLLMVRTTTGPCGDLAQIHSVLSVWSQTWEKRKETFIQCLHVPSPY